MEIASIGFALLVSHGFSHIASVAGMAWRVRRRPSPAPAGEPVPVTLLRPLRGLENHLEEALTTSFRLTYPKLELIFCVEDETDPVVPLVRRLIAAHPAVDARLLVGRDRLGGNPKVDNLAKGWRAASSDWIIMSDSNALLPADFVESLMSRWRSDTGLVSTAAYMTRPEGFAAEIECAFVNTFQARWLLLGDMIGWSFALGRTLMWRRDILERAGGIAALATEAADEVAATKAVRRMGLRVRLAQKPLAQAIGRRSFATVWRRQVRWNRLRRAGFPFAYVGEIFSGTLVPFACGVALAVAGLLSPLALAAYVVAWYGLEAALTAAARLPFSPRMPAAWILRDLLMPVLWVVGWAGSRIEWRGAALSVSQSPRSGQRAGK